MNGNFFLNFFSYVANKRHIAFWGFIFCFCGGMAFGVCKSTENKDAEKVAVIFYGTSSCGKSTVLQVASEYYNALYKDKQDGACFFSIDKLPFDLDEKFPLSKRDYDVLNQYGGETALSPAAQDASVCKYIKYLCEKEHENIVFCDAIIDSPKAIDFYRDMLAIAGIKTIFVLVYCPLQKALERTAHRNESAQKSNGYSDDDEDAFRDIGNDQRSVADVAGQFMSLYRPSPSPKLSPKASPAEEDRTSNDGENKEEGTEQQVSQCEEVVGTVTLQEIRMVPSLEQKRMLCHFFSSISLSEEDEISVSHGSVVTSISPKPQHDFVIDNTSDNEDVLKEQLKEFFEKHVFSKK